MRVGFYIQGYEYIGVEYLSAMLKQAGHEPIGYYDPRVWRNDMIYNERLGAVFNIEDLLIEQILNDRLDMLCFSVVTDNYATALRVARKVKQHVEIPIVFGGIHCTSVPERVAAQDVVDYVCVGEGEYALVELCDAIANGDRKPTVDNMWYQQGQGEMVAAPARPTIADLDSLPFPDKDLFYSVVPHFHKKEYITVASRGCVYACTFCNNSMYKRMYNRANNGRWHRRRSVDHLLDELEQALQKYEYTHVSFWDEIFIDNREWLEEFADKYKARIDKPFWCYGYVKFINPEVISLLEYANCNEINIGVQAVRQDTRRIIKRGDTNENIARALKELRESRIFVSTGNILQLPGQAREEAFEMAEFYNQHPPDLPIVGYLRYYPRTDIVQTGLDLGVITPEDVEKFEEAESETPFVVASENDAVEYRKAHTLILWTPWVPRFLIPLLLRTGLWHWVPTGIISSAIFVWILKIRANFIGKRHFPEQYGVFRFVYVMATYGWMKLRWLAGRRQPPPPTPKRCIQQEEESIA